MKICILFTRMINSEARMDQGVGAPLTWECPSHLWGLGPPQPGWSARRCAAAGRPLPAPASLLALECHLCCSPAWRAQGFTLVGESLQRHWRKQDESKASDSGVNTPTELLENWFYAFENQPLFDPWGTCTCGVRAASSQDYKSHFFCIVWPGLRLWLGCEFYVFFKNK